MSEPAAETASTYEGALRRLPPAYADVLRHTEAGLPDGEICARLEIEPEGLAALRDMAERKLRNLLT